MTPADHEALRELTAAYVLGGLTADERGAFEAHLETCDDCRGDVVSFAPLPSLLARVDLADLDDAGPGSADALVAAIRADRTALVRSRRRWRWVAGAAAAAAAVFGVLVVSDDEPARRGGGTPLAVEMAAGSGSARVVADERSWGTYVYVSAEDLPRRDSYLLWVVDVDGVWSPAGSWSSTDDGAADLGGSSRLPLEAIERVVVTSDDRDDEILVARGS